jgi:hypothetical protein
MHFAQVVSCGITSMEDAVMKQGDRVLDTVAAGMQWAV